MTIDFNAEFKRRLRDALDREITTIESGHKVWWPHLDKTGWFNSDTLRSIADYLDELNADWDAQIAKDVG